MVRTRDKRSFSLSAEAVGVLVQYQATAKAASLSAALDQLLREYQTEQKRLDLEAQITCYYDGLSDDEAAEESAWGEFASDQFRKTETVD